MDILFVSVSFNENYAKASAESLENTNVQTSSVGKTSSSAPDTSKQADNMLTRGKSVGKLRVIRLVARPLARQTPLKIGTFSMENLKIFSLHAIFL